MILVRCDCGETYQANEEHVGRGIRCKCGRTLKILAPFYQLPPASRAFARRAGVRQWLGYAAAAAGGLLLLVFVYLNGPAPAKNSENVASTSPSTLQVVQAPVTVQELKPVCPPDSVIRPKSGAELGGRYRGGLGKVQIENGTGSDAVTVLVDASTNNPRRAIFVRSGESGLITSVPAGSYRLRFQLGSDWLTARRFCQLSGTSEFDDQFDFTEVEADKGTNYRTYEVTLQPVLLGTATTHIVSNSDFELPEP